MLAMGLLATLLASRPAMTSIYFQYAIQDAAAVKGVALSNGLKGITP